MSFSATAVTFDKDCMHVALRDGRSLAVPLAFFPSLLNAKPAELAEVRIFGGGEGLHWETLDEDISVESLFLGRYGEQRSLDIAS